MRPLRVGDIVVRGPDWTWGSQDTSDDGKRQRGKVIKIHSPGSIFDVKVLWKHKEEFHDPIENDFSLSYRYREGVLHVIPVETPPPPTSRNLRVIKCTFSVVLLIKAPYLLTSTRCSIMGMYGTKKETSVRLTSDLTTTSLKFFEEI